MPGAGRAVAGAPRVGLRPAGSGKTMLAVDKARWLAAQGMRVLLTCYNRPLADHLKGVVRSYDRVQVFGFHELCTSLMKEAGVRLKLSSNVGPASYEELLPKALANASAVLGPRFDAIIADEAQDVASSWWLPLLTLLEDPDGGVLYVFSDDNQAIYRPPGGLPEELPEYRLCEDWRNSEPIFDLVQRFYRGEEIEFAGPEGRRSRCCRSRLDDYSLSLPAGPPEFSFLRQTVHALEGP